MKIKQFLQNNFEDLRSKVEFDRIMNEMPSTLKEEMIFYQYGQLIKDLTFFEDIRDNDLVWAILQRLNKVKYDAN